MRLLIKERVRLRLSDIQGWRWSEVIPKIENGILVTGYKKITDVTARKIIARQHLHCVASDRDMEIWDTADRDFQKKYGHRITVTDI